MEKTIQSVYISVNEPTVGQNPCKTITNEYLANGISVTIIFIGNEMHFTCEESNISHGGRLTIVQVANHEEALNQLGAIFETLYCDLHYVSTPFNGGYNRDGNFFLKTI